MKRRTKEPEPESGGIETEIMTVGEVADYLKIHYITVYRFIEAGLPAFRLGSDWRFRRADLDKWIAQRHVRPEESKPKPTPAAS